MIDTKYIVLFLGLAYLLGSFPSSVWLGRLFYGKDVREYGSGNAGATNTFRILGKKVGLPVLFLDIFKGWLAVNIIYIIPDLKFLPSKDLTEIKLALGISAVIGHLFPVYIGFRGGKGMATMLGLMIAVHAFGALSSIFIFIITFLISRYVSLSSIVASLFFPVILVFIFSCQDSLLIIFSIFVPILSLITHQKNIERLLRKEENKTKFAKK